MTPGHFSPGNLSPGARMLLGIAAGDAYGAPFENRTYIETAEMLKNQGLIPGKYTDDTQQALALAELIGAGEAVTPRSIAQFFLRAYARDPREGYSAMTRQMLASQDPDVFLVSISPEELHERKTDGAAMRALPLGFFTTRDEVVRNSMISASVTHGHPDAITATVAVALIAHETLQNRPLAQVWNRIRELIKEINPDIIPYLDSCAIPGIFDRTSILEEYEKYGVPYTESRIFIGSILALLASFGADPHALLVQSILLGGDTDSVAAVVVGASLTRDGDDLIWNLVDALENGPYGKDYLATVGEKVSKRFF